MNKHGIIFMLIVLFVGMFQNAYADIPVAERNALIELYNSTNGDSWLNKENWLGDAGSECAWYGVGCDSVIFET